MHRTIAAEKAIQTFKNHFLSGLTLCHSKFPLAEWNHLLEQAEITLNLLRSSRVNPTLSVYAQLKGHFDFNATPMAPPGTKVIIHDKPKHRASWALHGTDGFYIGPSLHHYRCVKCFIPSTKRDADTVRFIPEQTPIPSITIEDHLRQAATDIVTILSKPDLSNTIPSLEMGDETRNALLKIANALNQVAPMPELPQQSVPPVSTTSNTPTQKATTTQKLLDAIKRIKTRYDIHPGRHYHRRPTPRYIKKVQQSCNTTTSAIFDQYFLTSPLQLSITFTMSTENERK